ncbi:hypothetical protein [Nocardioides sp.]|uniref:hypothetical protein n=1 Tax=Nocardioides sp. TaxID=35761 RepID=UPI0035698EC4
MRKLLATSVKRNPVIITWTTFGFLDLAFWRLSSRFGERFIVIHDPIPLGSQFGHGRIAIRLGAWGAAGKRTHPVAHTALAAEELTKLGFREVHILPHPVKLRRSSPRPLQAARTILVAGQFKGARDLALLQSIAEIAPPAWRLKIVGRGWPEVAGWEVDARFLTEEELDEEMLNASAILIPYRFYFQSGIATRAYELGRPVVANRHEFISGLYGSAWAGLVDAPAGRAWVEAAEQVFDSRIEDLSEKMNQLSTSLWTAALSSAMSHTDGKKW